MDDPVTKTFRIAFTTAVVVLGTWAVPSGGLAAFPGANGPIVYTGDDGLWRIDPDGSRHRQLIKNRNGRASRWPAVSPDGQTVAFAFEWIRGHVGPDLDSPLPEVIAQGLVLIGI